MSSIIFNLFEVDRCFYLYDSNSNRILKLERENFNKLKKLKEDITQQELLKSFPKKFIKEASKYGVLQESQFREVNFGFNNVTDLKEYIQNNAESLVLIVTEQCNLRCKYCIYGSGNYTERREHSLNSMDYKIAIKSIREFLKRNKKSDKTPFICFYGGEPLLKWGMIKRIILQTKKESNKEKRWFINTNGVLLTEEKFYFLEKNNVMLRVSLDGPKNIHDRNRTGPGLKKTFNFIMENLSKLKRLYPEYYKKWVSISFVISNQKDLDLIEKFFNQNPTIKNIPKICSQVNNKLLKNENIASPIQKQKFEELSKRYIDALKNKDSKSSKLPFNFWWAKYLLNIKNRELRTLNKQESLPSFCIPAAHRLVVHPFGEYSFCIQGAECFNVGNVNTRIDYKSIFGILKKSEKILSKRCTKCWAVRLCPICLAFFSNKCDLDTRLLDQTCENIKEHLSNNFKLFFKINHKTPPILNKISPSEEIQD